MAKIWLQELSEIIDEATFKRACRQGKDKQNMRFLRAICLQPYLALVQGTKHADVQYDPSKTDVRVSEAFAKKLVQAIVQYAVDHHLPQGSHPNPSEAPAVSPSTPDQKMPTKRKILAALATSAEAGPSTAHATGKRRSARQPVAVEAYDPTMESASKRPAKTTHVSSPGAVKAAVADFESQAQKLHKQLKAAHDLGALDSVVAKYRQALTSCLRHAKGD